MALLQADRVSNSVVLLQDCWLVGMHGGLVFRLKHCFWLDSCRVHSGSDEKAFIWLHEGIDWKLLHF